jgi:hypothetical protein
MQFYFKGQIRHNLEVYVHDIIVKSHKGRSLIANVE